jgi:N,N'-diacetyllegionaminate synthase
MNYNDLKNPNHVFVIAEAGSNWKSNSYDADITQAQELIKTAKKCGADAVKFQTFKAKSVYVKNAGNSEYLEKTGHKDDIFKTFEDLSMPYEMIKNLSEICNKENIAFMSTPFSVEDAKAINEYVDIHKVASYEINHIRLLEYLAEQKKPVVISTGANSYEEINFAINFLKERNLHEIGILQCTAAYPAPLESMNLSVICDFQKKYNLPVGLSDHSLDPIVAPVMAVSFGATIIEKHFTLNKKLPGPDHKFALEPKELEKMIKYIRMAEKTKGIENKVILPIEEELRNFAVRSIQAINDISEGEILIEDKNFSILRSGNQKRGAEPRFFENMIGKKTKKTIKKGEGIRMEDLI